MQRKRRITNINRRLALNGASTTSNSTALPNISNFVYPILYIQFCISNFVSGLGPGRVCVTSHKFESYGPLGRISGKPCNGTSRVFSAENFSSTKFIVAAVRRSGGGRPAGLRRKPARPGRPGRGLEVAHDIPPHSPWYRQVAWHD